MTLLVTIYAIDLRRYPPVPYTSTHAHARRVKASRASAGLRARTEAIPIYYLCTKKFYYTLGDEAKLVLKPNTLPQLI